MTERRAYPSDLSDARWELIEPVLSAWRFERRGRALDFGRPPRHDLREIMNAILYVDRTGCQWAYLPHDFPPHQSVYGYFARWQKDGVFAQLNGLLRELVCQQEGKSPEPTACVIDAQSVKTSTSVPANSQGIDAGKKIVGRKRSIITDTLGLLLAVLVTAAGVQDSAAGQTLLNQVAADHPGLRKVWVDGGYRQPGTRGFTPIPKRWAVERTYGWLMLHRRLARDYETHPHRSEAIIHLAMTDLMARRLTGENTISWRDPTPAHQSRIPG
ncbi:IS5 family transposase [Streptomyces sp. NBC_00503]|uniref:IS5 family transposase n=1 Tax=Streptomyces sp. NBC_00503 TaxID=2903659 RepID=UPI002E8073D0|nr:IS5 family transposase [Streptomyces sp. NBC_00503]WUD85747.1 IS5 family transposase [Streptomyces sp. NBC_00503]